MPSLTSTLSRVDLNLLVALDVLLRERSVTKAAAVLGLTQPALSASLAKLRRYFNDDLLARVGNTYELTPLASGLKERIAAAMTANGRVFGASDDFDPVTSTREFTIYLSDYSTSVLAAPLCRLTRSQAPEVRIRIRQQGHRLVEDAAVTLRESDGIVLPHGFLSEAHHVDLFHDSFVGLVSSDNEAVGESISLEQLGRTPQVVAYQSQSGGLTAMLQLRMAGVEPWIDITTESFLAVPFLVAGTDRIGFVPSLLANRLAPLQEFRAVDLPIVTTEIVEALWWNPIHDDDAGHRWFRDVMLEAAGSIS